MNIIFGKKTKEENTTYDIMSSLSHTKWNCKYHIVFTPKYKRRIFLCREYYVDTVGKNAKRIAEYVRNQLQEDMMYDQISIKEYKDPFNGAEETHASEQL